VTLGLERDDEFCIRGSGTAGGEELEFRLWWSNEVELRERTDGVDKEPLEVGRLAPPWAAPTQVDAKAPTAPVEERSRSVNVSSEHCRIGPGTSNTYRRVRDTRPAGRQQTESEQHDALQCMEPVMHRGAQDHPGQLNGGGRA